MCDLDNLIYYYSLSVHFKYHRLNAGVPEHLLRLFEVNIIVIDDYNHRSLGSILKMETECEQLAFLFDDMAQW